MLNGKPIKINALTSEQTDRMYSIMQKYYDNIKKENFISDLFEKEDAILLCDENGDIYGFTTLAIFFHNKNTQLLYSGDTIVEKEYWGRNDLSEAWIKNAMNYADNFDGKTYWLLLTKGYKTYKFLHTFFVEFYPRVETKIPAEIQAIIDTFGAKHFGEKYQNGVFIEGKDFLKKDFDTISESNMRNKNTAFFIEKNPGYYKGDELVCITELSEENLNRLGRKMLGV
ncbi:MAG: hypothetical protein LBL93_00495 [Ruminococcus sp.]|jgi:hypothetical protein|nr:hypothetical protein [Ruminococcus sp.]